MTRRSQVGCLFLVLALFNCAAVFAEDARQNELVRLGTIVISPHRVPQPLDRVAENVSVIEEEELEDLPAQNPADALLFTPGIDVSSRTRFGHLVPLAIQGAHSRHVLLLADGIPFNTQASGQADVLPMLPLQNLERIELIKGSAASAWGYGLGGVVNLISKDVGDSPEPHGSFTQTWAEFDTLKESLELRGELVDFGYYFSAEHYESGGAREKGGTPNREDILQDKFFGKLARWLTDIWKLTGSFGYSGNEINEGVYPSDLSRSHVPYRARYGQLRLEGDPHERQHFEIAFKSNRQSVLTDSIDSTTETLLSTTAFTDHYYGAEFKSVTRPREEDLLVFGYDVSMQELKSNQMDRARDVWVQAPYGSYILSLAPFDITGALRYDSNDEFGDQWNPSLGAVYHLPKETRSLLRAKVTRSFSPPPILWKYFENVSPGVTANNPNIEPERAWTYEAGFESQAVQNLWLKLNVYRSDISDAIQTALNAEGLFSKQNFQKFRQQGFELESKLRVERGLFLWFSADFNDVEDRATDQMVQNRGVTRPGFHLGLDYEAPCGFEAHLLGRYDRWDSSSAVQPNDRKFIFDARFSHKLPRLWGGPFSATGFLNIYNLTNSKYWSDRDFPLPQRYFEGGVSIEF